MPKTPGGCYDLRKYMNDRKTLEIVGKIISGKSGYIPIIEKRVEPLKCKNCGFELSGEEKFCPECGTKVVKDEKQDNDIRQKES